ncbi:MAG: SDR family oxidoreductase [Planctomycetes bacterium]|nr:SDR family oxidoreductase [Planctomycetota bacterium]
MEKRFTDKVVVITGASRGIGAAIAKRFLQEGAAVCISANEARVHDTAKELSSIGKVFSLEVDVTKRSQIEDMYERVAKELGEVDISVQNAGISLISKLEDLKEEDWDRVLAINTKGVFLCCQAAGLRMRKNKKKGKLINTASAQARHGFIYSPHYAASKFGVMGLTQSLAKELAPAGITVNAFCPGIIDTDMWGYCDATWGNLLGDYKKGELKAEWVANIPMGRSGTGEDVANLVAFLASDDADYITGQTINVCGGMEMN